MFAEKKEGKRERGRNNIVRERERYSERQRVREREI